MSSEALNRRAILQVRCGPMAFRKGILEPGQVLTVGRAAANGLSLPHDTQLSDTHFELCWDGTNCRVQDLGSKSGTILGGQCLSHGFATNGEWIRAGSTDFSLYIEGTTSTSPSGEITAPHIQTNKIKALELLNKQPNLHAVLDAAQDTRILILLQESIEEYRSLYEGLQGEILADVAPYLVQLPSNSRLLQSLVQEGWGKHWGIYLTCDLPISEIRRNLRKFLMVEAEGIKGLMYFRFYDPRVLIAFTLACTAEQQKTFLGPIDRFFCECKEMDITEITIDKH